MVEEMINFKKFLGIGIALELVKFQASMKTG